MNVRLAVLVSETLLVLLQVRSQIGLPLGLGLKRNILILLLTPS